MADVHEPEMRSYNMSRIRSKDTKPELIVRKFLFGKGLRYRIHGRNLPGKPDIVLKKYKTVIFIHGCFWHSHEGCKSFKLPTSRLEYWVPKLKKNKQKDLVHLTELQSAGWKTIVVWECDLAKDKMNQTLMSLLRQIAK